MKGNHLEKPIDACKYCSGRPYHYYKLDFSNREIRECNSTVLWYHISLVNL